MHDNGKIAGLHWTIWLAIFIVGCVIFATQMSGRAHAQHRHEQHAQFHAFYQEWVNRNDKGCCNDRDCHPLNESDERQSAKGETEVFVKGLGIASGQSAWCKVEERHYLKKGNAPNWSTSHICVDMYSGITPCTQFICYQPRPQI
jgi:hypothetical protein